MALVFLPSSYALAVSGLKIGVAKVKITPEEPTILAGYSHGTDAMCYPPSDIFDDIYCRIMVAEDGSGNREVFLSMDVCVYMESDYYDPYNGVGVWWPKTVVQGTTQRFADAGNVGIDRVFVSATHTHQASEHLADKYIQRIVDGINTAKNNMIAVNVGYANTTYNINVNRRPDFGVHPGLECDKSLVLAIFRNASDNTPVASVVNYAVHNTASNIAKNKCSTELTGYAMNKIESNYGGGFVSLFFQGFEGDVGPNIDGQSYVDYDRSVSAGNTFGQDCTDILNSISVSSNPVTINGATSSQNLATKPGWGVSSQGVNFAAARIGDICFIGGSGEIFNQMGISLKLQSPFGAIVTSALVNGYCGYIPTLSGFYDGVGGDEVNSKCPWTSNIESIYMTEMSKLVSSLAGGTSLLGYSSIGGNAEITSANTLTVSKFNAGANMTLNNLKIYVQNATGKVRLGLFSDNGMDSFTLLQQTGEMTLSNGWNEGTITSANIGPGTYWIGFVFSDSGNTVYYESRKLGSYSQSYPFGPLPSKPSGMNWGGGMYSLYAGTGGTIAPVTGVSVSPTSATISVNGTLQLVATVLPSDATNKTVSWSSDNTSVATVSSTGLVTGIASGNATVTVTTQDGGKTATSVITVPGDGGSVIGLNEIGSVAETGNNGYWGASSFTAVSDVTVNRMNLYVTSASGKARLGIYSDSSGGPGTLLAQTGEISLSNGWNSGILGSPLNLASGSVYWLALEVNSSLTKLYSNLASGRLRYISYPYGTMPSTSPTGCDSGDRIFSIYADNSNGGGPVAVTGVSVSPTSANISINGTLQLAATVLPSDATNKSVSWSSGNTSVATVSSTGLVTGNAAGSATITVTTQDGGKTATSVITVPGGGGYVIGLNEIGSVAETGNNGYWGAISFTAISDITVNRMNIYVTSASGKGRLGIYSGNSGEPGTLLAQTDEISLSNGWNSGILGSPQNLTSGSVYWLALEVNSPLTKLYSNSASGRLRYISYTYGAMPSTAPTGCDSGDRIFSIYADNSNGGGSVIGLNEIGSIAETGNNGYWGASSFTAVSDVTVNRMNLYVTSASGKGRLGIYSGSSGEPGTLLAQTGEISLSNGWNSGILGSPQNLTSGSVYWLALEVNSSLTKLYSNLASGRLRYISYTYGAMPSTSPTGCDSGDRIFSIYADNSILKSANLNQRITGTNIDTGSQNRFVVYPNPNNNHVLYIKLALVNKSAIINILDLNGRVIYSKTFVDTGSAQQLDISGLKPGIYLVIINQGDARYNCKLIVE